MKRAIIFSTATILIASILGVVGSGHCLLDGDTSPSSSGAAPSLEGATVWLNSKPLPLQELRGKVVLIDFWTYTCINWRRTLPYVREWASKYKDKGLVVIGVHTPEFSFEYNVKNVSSAIAEMNIGYPVALDNNFEIWHSFRNEYWPALYLIDSKGQLRYQKFGEGEYQESELKIQELLKEASAKNVADNPVVLYPKGFEAAADWQNLQSPENYVGYSRTKGFVSDKEMEPNKRVIYTAPDQLRLNQWGLSGEWVVGNENVRLSMGGGKIIYRFHARDLHLIMGLAAPGTFVKFRVLIDGSRPGIAHGLDVDSDGNGVVSKQRMYQLIRERGSVINRDFQIEFFDPEVEVYDFTFG